MKHSEQKKALKGILWKDVGAQRSENILSYFFVEIFLNTFTWIGSFQKVMALDTISFLSL